MGGCTGWRRDRRLIPTPLVSSPHLDNTVRVSGVPHTEYA
jgi:hypothetical protein